MKLFATICLWVAQATGLCRPATRRTEWAGHRQPIKTANSSGRPCSFRSAGRRPARAGRPCYPFLKHALTICLLAIGCILTGCGEYYRPPPPVTPPGGTRPTSARIGYDISGMKTDFTKLDVAVLHKGKRLCTGKVEGEQLVLAFNRDSSVSLKELMLEITRDGKTLLKKDLESVRGADVRSLDQKGP